MIEGIDGGFVEQSQKWRSFAQPRNIVTDDIMTKEKGGGSAEFGKFPQLLLPDRLSRSDLKRLPLAAGADGIDPAPLIDLDIKEQSLIEELLVIHGHWVRSVIEGHPDGQ